MIGWNSPFVSPTIDGVTGGRIVFVVRVGSQDLVSPGHAGRVEGGLEAPLKDQLGPFVGRAVD